MAITKLFLKVTYIRCPDFIVVVRSDSTLFYDSLAIQLNPSVTGSCQFVSVCDQMKTVCGQDIDPKKLRQQCADFLETHPHLDSGTAIVNFIDQVAKSDEVSTWNRYVANLRKPNTHGDHITLQAMAKILNVQFLVASKKRNCSPTIHLISVSGHYSEFCPPLFLGHYDEREQEHYVSLSACTGVALGNLLSSVNAARPEEQQAVVAEKLTGNANHVAAEAQCPTSNTTDNNCQKKTVGATSIVENKQPCTEPVSVTLDCLLVGLDRYRSGARYPIPDTIGRSCTDTDTDTDTGNDINYSLGQTYLTYVAHTVCTFQNITPLTLRFETFETNCRLETIGVRATVLTVETGK